MPVLPESSIRRVLTVALACALLVGGVVGCTGGGAGSGAKGPASSQEMTAGQFPDVKPVPAQAPPPPMLKTPKAAVYSYLLWISYAYRVLNSDVATQAFGPNEEVRVNSYVELNRQKSRALDQRIVNYQVKSVTTEGATATVSATETWKYRYIDTKTGKYASPINEASYDTVYTVILGKTGWLVDSVKATAVGASPK